MQLSLRHAAVEAAGRLADGLLQLSATLPPVDAATQATLLLDFDMECMLEVPGSTPFCIAARSVRLAACSSVAGIASSSIVAAAVGSLELTRPEARGTSGSQVLVHAAGQQLADGQRRPAMQLLVPLR